MQLNFEAWIQIPKGVEPGCERRTKSNILRHFLGILNNLKEVKITLDVKTRKIYEIDILHTH